MAGVHGGDIYFNIGANTAGFNRSIENAKRQLKELDQLASIRKTTNSGLGKSISQVSKHTGKPINTIRSEVMKLAHTYEKQGMNMSSAMKKAYNEIGIYSNKTTSKAIKDAQDLYKSMYNKDPSKKASGMNSSKITAYRDYGLEKNRERLFDIGEPIDNRSLGEKIRSKISSANASISKLVEPVGAEAGARLADSISKGVEKSKVQTNITNQLAGVSKSSEKIGDDIGTTLGDNISKGVDKSLKKNGSGIIPDKYMNPDSVIAHKSYGIESDPNKIFDLPSKKDSLMSTLFGKNTNIVSNASKSISTEMDKAADNTTKSFKDAFASVDNMGVNLASKLGKWFSFAFLTKQVSRFAKSLLDAGGYFEQMTQGMQILFADTRNGANATAEEVNYAYNKMYENAMHAYKDTGMSANEYMETASSFATRIAQETKGDTTAAADIIDTMMKDMSDNWHLLGGDFEMIQNAYQGLLRGNYRMFDNLKLGYGQTKAEVERLLADAEKLSGIHYDVNNLSDIIKAVHEIQENTGMTGTTAREAMTTWAGATNMLAKSWENFKSMVGQGLIWLLQPVLQVIGKIADALTAIAFRFMMWAKNIMGIKDLIVGRQSNKEYKQAAANIGSINTGLGGTGGQAKAAKKAVKDLKRELLGFDKITKLSGEKGTTSGGTGTSGSSGTGGGLPDDEDLEDQTWFDRQVQQAQDYLSKIKIPEALQTALNNLKKSLSELFEIIANAGKWAWDNVLEPLGKWTINEAAPRIVQLLADAVKVINDVLKVLGVILEPIWEHLLKPIAKELGDVLLVALDGISSALKFTSAGLEVLKSILDELWEPLIKPIANFIATVVIAGLQALKEAIKIVGDILEWAAGKLKEFAKTGKLKITLPTWSELKQKLDQILGNFYTIIRNAAAKLGINLPTWSELKAKLVELLNHFYEHVRNAAAKLGINLPSLSSLKEKFDNTIWKPLKKAFGEFTVIVKFKKDNKSVNTVWGFLKKYSVFYITVGLIFNKKKFINELKNDINNAFIIPWNKTVRKHKATRSWVLPTLAQGGFVKANTPQLAVIGDNKREGEIVAPESKLAAMAQAAAGSGNEETNMLLRQLIALVAGLDLSVQLDGEQIKNNTVRRINNHTRSTGQLEILI